MQQVKSLLAVALIALAAGCSSSGGATAGAPDLQFQLTQFGSAADTFYFRGPMNVQYQLAIHNPTNATYTLRRLDLQSVGQGAYSIRTGNSPITRTIAAGGTTTIGLSAWARARGGYLTAEEPVTIRGIAYFEAPDGRHFQRVFTQTLSQFR